MTTTVMVRIYNTHLRKELLAEVLRGQIKIRYEIRRLKMVLQAVPYLVSREIRCIFWCWLNTVKDEATCYFADDTKKEDK